MKLVRFVVAFPDVGQLVFRYAFSMVGYFDPNPTVMDGLADFDLVVWTSVMDSVGQEVVQDLLDPGCIGMDHSLLVGCNCDLVALSFSQFADSGDDVTDRFGQVIVR